MKAIRYLMGCTLVLLLGSSLPAAAEDIDIYSGGATTGIPNVLLVLDSSASLDSNAGSCTYADGSGAPTGTNLFALEFCSLYNVIYALPVNTDGTARVNIGFMVYNGAGVVGYGNGGAKGCQASSNNGGCLVKTLTAMNAINKTIWMNWIKGLAESSIKSNSESTATAMWEAWAYFSGQNGVNSPALVPSGIDYSSIQPPASCQKNYVVFIGNAANNTSSPGDPASPSVSTGLASAYATQVAPAPTKPPAGVIVIPSGNYGLNPVSVAANQCTTGGANYTMPSNHNDSSGLYGDEWTRFMYGTDVYNSTSGTQNITTYTIGVLGPTSCKPDYPALLSSMATVGGGKFYPVSASASSDLTNALLTILNEVQSVNSVFASSSLPVSVNAQGSYLNQIYMGMFRPDPSGLPRWAGNLKQYQFIVNSTGNLQLGDAAGAAAISSSTGFVAPAASSFWTCTSSSNPLYTTSPYSTIAISSSGTPACPLTADPSVGFWANNGLYTSATYGGKAYDLADGELVDKGGAAQQLRLANLTATYPTNTTPSGNSPRNMYTYCPLGTSCNCSMGPGGTGGSGCNLTDPSNVFDVSNPNITDQVLGTGTRTITLIQSAPTVTKTSTPVALVNTTAGLPITITGATSGNTISAANGWPSWLNTLGYTTGVIDTASAADVAKIGLPGAQAWVAYGGSPAISCLVFVLTPTTFGYATQSGGTTYTTCLKTTSSGAWTTVQPSPIGAQSATLLTAVTVTTNTAHGLQPGQVLTFNGCTVLTSLNNSSNSSVFGTVRTVPTATTFTASFNTSSPPMGTDTNCTYAPNTATVTSNGHNLPQGDQVTITGAVTAAGATVAGYNGTWYINIIDANTFSFQYTAPAPLSDAVSATLNTVTTRTQLINWVRGQDNVGDEASLCPPGVTAGSGNCPSSGAVTARPSMHGDVLHSRPSVVDYGGSTGVVAFYGSNDGAYHAVDGNQPTFTNSVTGATVSDSHAGQELWAFVPARYYTRLTRLRANSPVMKMPSTPAGIYPWPQGKDYFFDGSTSVYQLVNTNGTAKSVYIYLTARRGSRALWAMDVTTPSSPKLLWKIDNTTNSSGAASTQFAELGQTWSSPRLVPVSGWPNPVLIFGAGYDPAAEDVDPPLTDTMGRGIFIVDAVTGQLVWSASPTGTTGCTGSGTTLQCHVAVPNMTYSIPSDITMMDIDGDGQIDRLYAADVGGNVWRVDLEPKAITADAWQVEQIAALGCATGACASGTSPRKFLFGPDVIKTQNFTAVFVGSGNRESPLNPPTSVTNRLYMLMDTATGPDGSALPIITEQGGSGYNLDDCTGTTANPNTCSTATTGASTPVSYGVLSTAQQKSGYYIALNSQEQCVNAPVAFGGYVYFGTNQPTTVSANACVGSLGIARGYQLSAFGGNYSSILYTGGGLPPTPVAGVVTVGNKQYPFLIGGADPTCLTADCKSAFGGHQVKVNVPSNRYRTYRYQEGK